ncbi:MAG: hypothetical protein DMG96_19765 [Acidobacteria bacterium]|nr:MAG: hypothetical protein DMG96_19765 [Acidobacteriota bacterium]
MSPHESEPTTFGIVAGLGMGAGIFYYRSLVNAHLARGLSPRILMVHADVRRVMAHAAARETRLLATYLAGLRRQLADGGAQLGTIPAFSPQICAQELAEMTPVPLVSPLAMETNLFGRLQHVEVVSPSPEEIDLVANTYVRIVEDEQASQHDYENLRVLAHTLIHRERLDAILLAGTDLSFVFNPENTDFPHLDGARVHIDAIMRRLTSDGA